MSTSASSPLRLLRCPVQTYHWGHKGRQSLVGRLAEQGLHLEESTTVDPNVPYAELWMGTHPSKPSIVRDNGRLLRDEIAATERLRSTSPASSVAANNIAQTSDGSLSFLFKVLSVETALSIQAHPNKQLAAELRVRDPDHYPDDNHKPELAIALGDFEALCCFRPLNEIEFFLQQVPELAAVIGASMCSDPNRASAADTQTVTETGVHVKDKNDLKRAYTALMTAPSDIFQPALQKLIDRLAREKAVVKPVAGSMSTASLSSPPATEQSGSASSCLKADFALSNKATLTTLTADLVDVLLRISAQYPNDIGLFSVFFLNYVRLHAGESLFLAANEPHAYLSGECVECMATSDNVVRAGLTPKFKDVNTLVKMLTYEPTADPRFLPEHVTTQVIDSQGFISNDICKTTNYSDAATGPIQNRDTSHGTSNSGGYGCAIFRYRPPVDDFAVLRYALQSGATHQLLATEFSSSILIVIEGTGILIRFEYSGNTFIQAEKLAVHTGSVVFIPLGCRVTVAADRTDDGVAASTKVSDQALLLFQAYTP